MTDNKHHSTPGGGLVQNLLFPSFVDAGANDTFHPRRQQGHDEEEALDRHRQPHDDITAAQFGGDEHLPLASTVDRDESVISDASTEVKHNLSAHPHRHHPPASASRNIHQTDVTLSEDRIVRKSPYNTPSQYERQSMGGLKQTASVDRGRQFPPSPGQPPPSFFASTRPRSNSLTTTTTTLSPYHSTRQQPQQRMWIEPASPPHVSRCSRSLSIESSSDDDEERSHPRANVKSEEPSPSNLATATAAGIIQELKTDADGRPMSQPGDGDTPNGVEHGSVLLASNRGHDRMSSLQQPDYPLRVVVSDAAEEPQQFSEEEQHWEEEATPAQTAFAKELLFRRKDVRHDEDDNFAGDNEDDMSTASEMGTVVGMERLDELDDDMDVFYTEQSQRSLRTATPLHDLALPDLNNNNPCSSATDDDDEKKDADQEPGSDTILSRAIRRIESFRDSSTAPNSPRRIQPLTPRGRLMEYAPSSFLLRSPGSAVHTSAKKIEHRRRSLLSPRFTSLKREDASTAAPLMTPKVDTEASTLQAVRPFFLTRGCFSFDTFDTTLDDEFEIPYVNKLGHDRTQHPIPSQSIPFRPRSSHIMQRLSHENQQSHVFASPKRSKTMPVDAKSSQLQLKPGRTESPDRLVIERDDALDILACLVERGIALNSSGAEVDDCAAGAETDQGGETVTLNAESTSKLDVSELIDQLKELSAQGSEGATGHDHRQRLAALDELVKSHQYAIEMRRASQSASAWLNSVGRHVQAKGDDMINQLSKSRASSESQAAGESASEDLDLLTYKAMLHAAQIKAREKSSHIDRLNDELAKCKAEIGRLKSAATSTSVSFRSPNRSILDEEEDDGLETVFDVSFGDASPILDSSEIAEDVNRFVSEGADASQLKKAFDEDNALIANVKSKHTRTNSGPTPKRVSGTSPKDAGRINESYVSDWDDLEALLFSSPTQDLQSPAVTDVLAEWTSDTQLHESLLSWIESAVSDEDLSGIPPLMLSSLDQHVRDGFIMQVLPALLKRPDIKIDVKSRIRRTTTYDLSVTVESTPTTSSSPIRRQGSFAESTTHSTATALVNNTHMATPRFSFDEHNQDFAMQQASSRLSYDEMADAPRAPGETTPGPGIISTLGGALGYLSSLRRPPTTPGGRASAETPTMRTFLEQSPARPSETAVEYHQDAGGDKTDDFVHPFHRVLSAPAGRLCITFVDYRGHAMVSDVAPESPLVGFIFPSDVLIAIDELAVSGMRIRDIIKLLKDRSNKPTRALRVISSHDMTALTLHTSVVHDGAD